MRIEQQIDLVKRQLMALGPMRPGAITMQYRFPKEKKKPFYQISYTHQMRSRSQYVRPQHLKALRRETATFRKFRKLIQKWVDLALLASQSRIKNDNLLPSS